MRINPSPRVLESVIEFHFIRTAYRCVTAHADESDEGQCAR